MDPNNSQPKNPSPEGPPAQEPETPQPTPPAQPEQTPTVSPIPTVIQPDARKPVLKPKARRKGRKLLIILVCLLAIAGAAFFAIKQISKPVEINTPSTTKKDIPLIRSALDSSPTDKFYPNTGIIDGEIYMNAQIFEGLVRYEDSTKLTPTLATGWSNPDDSTWLFDLKKDVKFHSGKTMTADDVKYSLEYIQANNEELGDSFASTIKTIEVVDPNKVKITTDGPDPTLLNKLTYLYIIDKDAEVGDPASGTGPYAVKPGTKPEPASLNLVAFDDYHGGHVYTRELQFQSLTIEEQVAAFKKGELDIIGALSLDAINQLEDAEKFETQNYGVFYMGLNSLKEDSPLQKLQFRQALRYAIDVPALLKNSNTDGKVATQLMPSFIPGYNPDIKAATYDVAKAKELIAEAGYSSEVTLNLLHGSVRADIAKELTRQLALVGVKVNSQVDDTDAFFDTALGGGTDMFLIEYGSDILDGSDVFKATAQQTDNYMNEELDSLLEEADKTLDQSARLKILQEASQLTVDDVAAIPFAVVSEYYALSKPYSIKQSMPIAQTGAYFWQVYQE